MNDTLFGNKVMFLSLKGPHECIELFVIGGVVEENTMKFFIKVSNGVSSLQQNRILA